MGMLDTQADRVGRGETVEFRPTGGSMAPLVHSRQKVRVAPADPGLVEVGDIVLARVAGTVYLHLVSAVDAPRRRVQISNNHGHVNGWTGYDRVLGICLAVDGVPRPGAAAKVRRLPVRPVALATARLELLPLRPEHADEMSLVLSDPALHSFTGGAPLTRDALRARYERLTAGSPDPAVVWANWVLRLRGTGRLVGTVQATVTPAQGLAELAWVIGVPWQGEGFASEAARALAAWLEQLPVDRLVAHIHPDHAASAAVARACGLRPTGHRVDGEVRWQSSGVRPAAPA
ncbi:GNAT family N-acetyltransferase [Streptomyces sp. fd1-xmd]|uniref:GNAT family N-acetyltransferase n=1 Tax=Streptomyces sp. fd1-xmd TaxID=1812480 RepID=UPI00268DFE9E|nr:GNAT family N-acetyltransferase [Streptomyces sp. fd1-xmd]